jgi:hypothetical protein
MRCTGSKTGAKGSYKPVQIPRFPPVLIDDPWFLVAFSWFGLSSVFGVAPCILLRCFSQVFRRVVQV